MTVYVVSEANYAGCCGVRELCEFTAVSLSTSTSGWAFSGNGESLEEAWTDLIKRSSYLLSCAFVHVWFVKYTNYAGNFNGQEYANDEFRQVVKRIKGVVPLGEGRNPNTGNIIDGYMWAKTEEIEFNDKT